MVYVFLAEGFEETEALVPVDMLRRMGCDVKTVGVGGKEVTGSHGITVTADLEEKDVDTDLTEMVFLPGGLPGTYNLEKSPIVRAAVEAAAECGAYVAAICAAPSVLGHLGLLRGQKATCAPGFESELEGAEHVKEPVVASGKFITGWGAGAALPFALRLGEALCGREKADEVAAKIGYVRP